MVELDRNQFNELSPELAKRYQKLREILAEMGQALIAMSGGVDSVLLARVAAGVLGPGALAVTADSPSLPRRELEETIRLAQRFGIPHRVIQTHEVNDRRYAANPVDRCYFCKDELFDRLDELAQELGYRWVLFGENEDDRSDHRPGEEAARQHGVRAPLREAGFNKEDIRTLAKAYGLPVWDKPASACLASRIPYGSPVTPEKLAQVEAAEDYLWELGLHGFRVRHHGEIARLEVEPGQMAQVIERAGAIAARLKEIGFKYITLDLDGYRRGSLNEGILISKESVG